MNISVKSINEFCQSYDDGGSFPGCEEPRIHVAHDTVGWNSSTLIRINNFLTEIATPWGCVVGIVVILVTVVMVRSRCIGNTTYSSYLVALGIIDVFGLFNIVLISERTLSALGIPRLWQQLTAPYMTTLIQMVVFMSNWMTVALALDRHQAICRPLLHIKKTASSSHKKKTIILTILLISTLLYIPQFFRFSGYLQTSNGTVTLLIFSSIGLNRLYQTLHLWIVTLVLLLLLPALIILTVNTHLVICVTSSTRLVYQSTQLSISDSVKASFKRENIKISTLLFCLILSFFCLQLPMVVLLFLATYEPHCFNNRITVLFSNVVTFLYVLKNDINFLFYLWLSKRFIRTIQAFVCLNCNYMLIKGSSIKSRLSSIRRRSNPI